jgi:flavorubredoxin
VDCHRRSAANVAGAALVLVGAGLTVLAELPVRARMRVVEGGGTAGAALIVYHPGLSAFPERVARVVAHGLVSRGTTVHLASAPRHAPTDIARYNLLVLVAPTYWWAPARPVSRYVDALGPLRGAPVAVVVTASGQAGRSRRLLEARVRAASGRVVAARSFFTWAPNVEAHYSMRGNQDDGVRLAEAFGAELAGARVGGQP